MSNNKIKFGNETNNVHDNTIIVNATNTSSINKDSTYISPLRSTNTINTENIIYNPSSKEVSRTTGLAAVSITRTTSTGNLSRNQDVIINAFDSLDFNTNSSIFDVNLNNGTIIVKKTGIYQLKGELRFELTSNAFGKMVETKFKINNAI
eukprot:Pgem_evm1s486